MSDLAAVHSRVTQERLGKSGADMHCGERDTFKRKIQKIQHLSLIAHRQTEIGATETNMSGSILSLPPTTTTTTKICYFPLKHT